MIGFENIILINEKVGRGNKRTDVIAQQTQMFYPGFPQYKAGVIIRRLFSEPSDDQRVKGLNGNSALITLQVF